MASLLSSPFAALLALLFALLYFAVGAVVNHRKLRQFRGPPFAGYSLFWAFWQSVHARLGKAEFEAIQRYGASSPDNNVPRYLSLLC